MKGILEWDGDSHGSGQGEVVIFANIMCFHETVREIYICLSEN